MGDTPGLDATVDEANHAHALRAAFGGGKNKHMTHLVVFVVEMNDRIGDIRQKIKRHYEVLEPFHRNLIVLLNKSDRVLESMDLDLEIKQAYIREIDKSLECAGCIFYHHGVGDSWLRKTLE